MRTVIGSFNGTGAAVTICLGGIPKRVVLYSDGDTGCAKIEWIEEMGTVSMSEGWGIEGTSPTVADLAIAGGISAYHGGVQLTSTLQTTTTYGEGVYLAANGEQSVECVTHADQRVAYAKGGFAADTMIDTYTRSTTNQGVFNAPLYATTAISNRVGIGSPIYIKANSDGRLWQTRIHSYDNDGDAASDINLTADAPSGKVVFIGCSNTHSPMAVGNRTSDGFTVSLTSGSNENDERQCFVAWI